MTTATLPDLRENLRLTTEVYGRGSMRTTTAFEQLARAAALNGTPLDALRHYVEDEVERFFSYTLQGADGHIFWDGASTFRRNDGKERKPLRWWWARRYGALQNSDDLVIKCGQPHCVNPEHAAKERTRGAQLRWTEQRIIGALQVTAGRLGHSPTPTEWQELKLSPDHSVVCRRFGSWTRALEAANLPPCKQVAHDKNAVLRGIQLVRRLIGRWPSEHEYLRHSKELLAADLPAATSAATRHYGSFVKARKAAGGPDLMPGVSMGRAGTFGNLGGGYTREQCMEAILFVKTRLGRWPSCAEFLHEREALSAAGLPFGEHPFRRLFGSFVAARVAAGGIPSLRVEEHLRPPHISRTSPEKILAGIHLVHERLGRWPSQGEYNAEGVALRAAGLPGSWGPAYKVFGSFTAARVAAGGPERLAGSQAARRLARTRQRRKER